MMLVLLESKKDIALAQKGLEATFARQFPRRTTRDISHPGGTRKDARVFTDGKHWYWPNHTDTADQPNPRTLNWLGQFEPNEKFNLRIAVEANMPFEGRNDRISGFLARDAESGTIYLLHSGRIGGGAKGVGKVEFLKWRNEPLYEAVDASGKARAGVIVMPIEGRGATRPATRFIDTVARFKEAVNKGEVARRQKKHRQHELGVFFREGRGRRRGRRSSIIDYVSRHGEIVDALYEWRVAKGSVSASQIRKNVLVDLAVKVGSYMSELYEVKTGAARGDMYAAIGQLLVYAERDDCRRTVVVPHDDDLAQDVAAALKRLKIRTLRFKLSESSAAIVA